MTGPQISVGAASPVTPHNQALYEAGKDMLVGSLAVGRDFCNFMVGVSTGGIPLYLAILALALPKDYRPDWWHGVLEIIPAAAFLAAAILFAIGLFPRNASFSLDEPDAIDKARGKAISWRRRFSAIGFVIFSLAALASIVVTVAALRVKTPTSPQKPTLVKLVK